MLVETESKETTTSKDERIMIVCKRKTNQFHIKIGKEWKPIGRARKVSECWVLELYEKPIGVTLTEFLRLSSLTTYTYNFKNDLIKAVKAWDPTS